MTYTKFLGEKIIAITLNFFLAYCLSGYLFILDVTIDELLLILISWGIFLFASLIYEFLKYKNDETKLKFLLSELESGHLIIEIMDKPNTYIANHYYEILKKASQSMISQVATANDNITEYREYIEQWIHNIKVPITTGKLICENNKNEVTRKVILSLEQIEHNVEQALYFARKDYVYKDYILKEVSLKAIVKESLSNNKQSFILKNGQVKVFEEEVFVCTDKQWIIFIINQIISNSLKYSSISPFIEFSLDKDEAFTTLTIKDNGIGIDPSEIARVFEKGFTGSNGRIYGNATGMGLYICKCLCDNLGIILKVTSNPSQFTTISLSFKNEDKYYLTKV